MRDILFFTIIAGYLLFRNSNSFRIIDSNDYSIDNFMWYNPNTYHIKTTSNITVKLVYDNMSKLYNLEPMINYSINLTQYKKIKHILIRNSNNHGVLIRYKYSYFPFY